MPTFLFKSYWLLIPFIFTGCFLGHQGVMNRRWPVKYGFGTPQQLASVGEGYILQKNNDTLKGYIRMETRYYSGQKITTVPLLPFGKKNKADLMEVNLDDIDYVRIKWYYPGAANYDFMPIRSAMWLVVGRKDPVRVCSQTWDNSTSADNLIYEDEMVVVEGKKIIEIPIAGINAWNPRTSYVRKFINKRYGQHFTKNDLRTEKELIDYILDQETKRLPGA